MRIPCFRILVLPMVFIACGASSHGKSWREITPMKSTRADVVRLFKQCSDVAPRCEFQVDDEVVLIEFSGNATAKAHECSNELAPDTVLLIEVIPRKDLTIEDLHLDRKSFKILKFLYRPGMTEIGYINGKDGLLLRTYKEKTESIIRIDYVAIPGDTGLCKSYYADLESFVDEIPTDPPPVMNLAGPTAPVHAGDRIVFTAFAGTKASLKRSFNWTISAGKIVSQTTHELIVDTTGLEGKTVRATASLYPWVTAWNEVQILPK